MEHVCPQYASATAGKQDVGLGIRRRDHDLREVAVQRHTLFGSDYYPIESYSTEPMVIDEPDVQAGNNGGSDSVRDEMADGVS
jgi:hypothetical protein